MAGEKLSLQELKDWYAQFNTIIKKYGGGSISQLTTPDGGLAVPADVNDVYNKINEMKNDTYLGSQANLYTTGTAAAKGGKITRASTTPIDTTADKITEKIKCRNTTTFSNGYHTNTKKSHTANSHGADSQGTNYNGARGKGNNNNQNNANGCSYVSGCKTNWCNNGLCYWGQQSNGNEYNGTQSNGAWSHTIKSNGDNTHSAKSHTTQIDILNVNTTTNKN